MGWILAMLALTNIVSVWFWLGQRTARRALDARLKTSDWLLESCREALDEERLNRYYDRVEANENDDYLSATGGCSCNQQCAMCDRDEAEYHEQDNLDFVASEGVGAVLNAYHPGWRVGYLGLSTWIDDDNSEEEAREHRRNHEETEAENWKLWHGGEDEDPDYAKIMDEAEDELEALCPNNT